MLRKSAGSATAKWRKQLREDPAMRGVLVAQFSKLAEVVAEVLNREWVLDEGPYAADPGSPLSWFKVNMYHICQHFIIPLTSEHACSYVELVASDLQPPGAWAKIRTCWRCKNDLALFFYVCVFLAYLALFCKKPRILTLRMDGVSCMEHPLCSHCRDAEAACAFSETTGVNGDVLLVLHVGQQSARPLFSTRS